MTLSPALTRLASALSRRRRLLLVALLGILYFVLLLGPGNRLAQTLFVAHVGLFILWQPFVRADKRLSPLALLSLTLAVGGTALTLNGWMLALWVTLLAGVVGGKVFLFEARWTKLFYLLALAWLVSALLLLALPEAMPAGMNAGTLVTSLGRWLSPAVFVAMLAVPERGETDQQPEVVDFVYSLIVVLLLSVLVLGSLALILLLRHAYVEALLESLLVIGVMLLILGWVWNPHAGIAGMGTVFSRFLLSIGLPVEQWLHALADLAHRQEDPGQFVAEACSEMVRRLPWVTGVEWESESERGRFGTARGQRSEFRFGALSLAIHTRYPLSPSLAWHFRLLAQMIAEFYDDKRRARELKRLSYVQAIHETGARLTHDVKNLLQALRALCSAAEGESGEASPEFVALLRRQLPAITSRLGQTLDKLQMPSLDGEQSLPLLRWWDDLRRRFALAPVSFVCHPGVPLDQPVPAALFNHVMENLLANALRKRATAGTVKVDVVLGNSGTGLALEVADDGDPVPPALTSELLQGPVRSEQGMGIGLYQAARLARQGGYELSLVENRPGQVRFRLAAAAAATV